MPNASFYSSVPSTQTQADALTAYLDFLGARNGPDFRDREARMGSTFAPSRVQARMPIDAERFNRNYVSFSDRNVTQEELALLAFVKVNAGEAYGVEVVGKARRKHQQGPGIDARVERVLTREEQFHTRLLVGAAGHFEGLTVTGAWKPAWPLRLLIGTLARLPGPLFHPLLLGSEIAGVHSFDWMLRRLRTLFRDEPQVRESMEQRLIEILIDEVGHIAFNRLMVGKAGLATALPLAKLVAQSHQVTGKELLALGYGEPELGRLDRFDFADLPDEVKRRAFFV